MELSTAPFPASIASIESEGTPENAGAEEVPLLVFRLQESLFAVPALAVREILLLPALSPLAETAPFVVGVLNLRGAIVPVMDLNARLGRPSPPLRLEDALIVLDWNGALVAILADEARIVSHIPQTHIEAPPTHGRASDEAAPFVAGVIRGGEGIVMLLHLPHLLGFDATTSGRAPALAPRFDLQLWTPRQRAVLQARALRLRSDFEAAFDEISSTESTKNEARDAQNATDSATEESAPDENRAPVAVVALGGEEFGVALQSVREFAAVSALTRVPCCPPHILGQINLRGEIVTLIDARPALRTARATPPFFPAANAGSTAPATRRAHPVVVVSHGDGAVGIVVDDVRDVLYPREEFAREATDASSANFFAGSTLYQGRLLPLLDVARLLEEGHLDVEENA